MQEEYRNLDPALRFRIRRTCQITALWGAFLAVSTGVFFASRPYLDKRRKARMKLSVPKSGTEDVIT